ncbi:LexA family transcriptional regulator [Pandoraea sp. XJJ-1]|uniref:LexA family protein n=1 Tax=Pandoraea sp. XJJ-1 TaxID=3002643 RepID=UPI00227FF9AB|nr:S24 family peptidase [Pandoraea sp. XJJ-1]WAL81338.1 LexA family transcriptional regulator [Pandoraea sp. XJJ-1]
MYIQAMLNPKNPTAPDVAARLKTALKASEKKAADLARALRVTPQAVSGWLKTGRIDKAKIPEVARELGVTSDYLLAGETMRSNVAEPELRQRRVPVISYVQAGAMAEAVDAYPIGGALRHVYATVECSDCTFALEVEGESMLPDFKEGDVIFVDPLVQPKPGQFVVAKNCEEKATFKKYRPRGVDENGNDVFELVPLNPDFATIYSDRQPMHIVGTVVEHRRNLTR